MSKVNTTVGTLMSWYAGDDWHTLEAQAVCAMSVGSEHAEDDGQEGLSHLQTLKAAENEEIEVDSEDEGCAYDITFELDGNVYSFQSIEMALVTIDY